MSPKLAQLSPVLAHLSPKLTHLSPKMSYVSPDLSNLANLSTLLATPFQRFLLFLPNMLAPPSEVEVSHEKYTRKI